MSEFRPDPKDEPTKLKKAWRWTKNHADELALATVGATIASLYVWIVAESFKEQKQAAEETIKAIQDYNDYANRTNDWLVENANAGNDVYLVDPENSLYLVLSKDTPRELHART